VVQLPGSDRGASVIVCDGAGALSGSGPIAREVTELAANALRERPLEDGIWALPGVFGQAASAAHAEVKAEAPEDPGATTLLTLSADAAGRVGHFMIGNGTLVEAEPRLPGSVGAGMSWVGLALPQVSLADGHPTLRSFLPCADPASLEYAAGIRETRCPGARIFLACSDGIASDEECPTGFAPNGTQWKEVPRPLARLLDRLAADWLTLCSTVTPEKTLGDLIRAVLDDLLSAEVLTDDATLGALFLRAAPQGGKRS
jgi:hypothetical protein